MSLAQFADVHFGYPGNDILSGASLLVRPGERLALVGPNGTGKSTALRLLAGDIKPDAGDARVLGRASVAYLRQSQELAGSGTVMDALMEPFAALLALHEELSRIEGHLGTATEAELSRYGELQERYAHEGGYDLESRVKRLITDVGFPEADLARGVDTLSGGERGRLELAKVLVRQPDLLLMDEPTNHLDLAAIERLEAYLGEYPGAFILVSHDRAFIRRTCREVVELEDGKFVRYPYGYDKYVAERAERLERARIDYERQKEHVEKTEDFIRRNLAGQKTKQAQSRRKMLEKLERLERPDDHWELAGRISLSFQTGGDLGNKEAIRAPHVTVGYPGKAVLEDVTVNVYRGDRIGIVGPNGCGKSTLLKTLVGELAPLAGEIARGTGLRIGYYDQKLGSLDESRTLIDEIRSVRADLSPDVVRSYLAKFRFFEDDPFRTVKGLSGGERSRLSMAKMMLFPRNLLALDEPTNHLDIPAREVLEEALARYDGTILIVSHDRYFLDQVCTRLLVVSEGPGGKATLESHAGNYGDWRARLGRDTPAKAVAPVAPTPDRRETKTKAPERRETKTKASGAPTRKEGGGRTTSPSYERELRRAETRVVDLETEIAAMETERAAIAAALSQDPGGDWTKLHALADRDQALRERHARCLEEWERASAQVARLRQTAPGVGSRG